MGSGLSRIRRIIADKNSATHPRSSVKSVEIRVLFVICFCGEAIDAVQRSEPHAGGGFNGREFGGLELAGLLRLPDAAGGDVERREPAVAVAVGVDADEVAEVEDFGLLVRRVTEDRGTAGEMGFRRVPLERLPAEVAPRLAIQRAAGEVVAVDEKVARPFDHVAPTADEFDVFGFDLANAKTFAVGVERLGAAVDEPFLDRHQAVDRVEHHLLVVALNALDVALLAKSEQLIDAVAAVGAAVDHVAEDDERIVGSELQSVDERRQGCVAAVDVADGDGARGGLHDGTRHGFVDSERRLLRS